MNTPIENPPARSHHGQIAVACFAVLFLVMAVIPTLLNGLFFRCIGAQNPWDVSNFYNRHPTYGRFAVRFFIVPEILGDKSRAMKRYYDWQFELGAGFDPNIYTY